MTPQIELGQSFVLFCLLLPIFFLVHGQEITLTIELHDSIGNAAEIYNRLGFTFESMKGRSVWGLFAELKGPVVERELRAVIADHLQVSYEFFYPKDERWYETKGYPTSPGAILVFRDITYKKATHQ